MKKICIFLSLVILCCSLCACDPASNTAGSIGQEALENVISIELIQYENPEQSSFAFWAPDHFDKLLPFDSSQATVLEILPAEKTSDFLDTFSETGILVEYYAYDSPKDVCLRLNYENDNFLIIWANYAEDSHAGYIGEYSSDGTVLSFWGSFESLQDYTDLVEQFFDYSLT